ncbi:glycoside hydrolase domain-containing protein [Bacillus pretiosus]|uniref:glycoside hydrolase domain-containing protein n=1 Tax=Bacillus pretiosus TaxID=2983392 RepID=UPI003D64A7FF
MVETKGDPAVFAVQTWVNLKYGKVAGFQPAPLNGKTGWSTVYALTRALQIELGITSLADAFGPTTASKYKQWGEMTLGQVPRDAKGKAIVQILKGAMYCKGYNPGKFDDVFDEKTKNAVVSLQKDAGLPVTDGTVYDYIFKAFLTMDAYRLTPGGDAKVRQIQQDLNNKYYKTSGVQPTDGHYQRGTNKALVFGLQTEMGIAAGSQTGSIGPATKNGLPILKVGSSGRFVTLFQYALYFNGHDSGSFSTTYNANVESAVKKFQGFTLLPIDGVANKSTWLSALVSTGDPDRKGKACDCITEVTLERGKALKAAGYETVGRYLVNVAGGINKKIQPGELKNIFAAGLSVFPIYQANGREASSFSATQGRVDAEAAFKAAKEYGFKNDTTIYFAVDFDAYGIDITDNILPHFKALNEKMLELGGSYKVGVYGARNVCIQVSEKGYAKTSFVSGMSTGFSGNLGYPLPKNWAFDQISTIKVGSGSGAIEIDNNIKSGRDNGVSEIGKPTDVNGAFLNELGKIQILALEYTKGDLYLANYLVTNYYRQGRYVGKAWTLTSGPLDEKFAAFVNDTMGKGPRKNGVDPISGLEMDTPHMMATLSGVLFANYPIVGANVQDFAGWAGDLFTVTTDAFVYRGRYGDGKIDMNQKTYLAAYDFIGGKSEEALNFDYKDLLGDVDAFNIGKMLKENAKLTIYEATKLYYSGPVMNRYTQFFKGKFKNDYNTMKTDAENVMNGMSIELIAIREALRAVNPKLLVPHYTDEEGNMIAKAFADKIRNLAGKE